jgi:hypothetical protein
MACRRSNEVSEMTLKQSGGAVVESGSGTPAAGLEQTSDVMRAEAFPDVQQFVEQLTPPLVQQLADMLQNARIARRPATLKHTLSPKPPDFYDAPKRRWTVAIYMVADGPSGNEALDAVALDELDDIYAAAQNRPNLHVAVQVDLSDQNGLIRFEVGGELHRIPEEDAAKEKTLEGFFNWVAESCPAEEYVIVFWGHSSGPVGLFGDRASLQEPISRLTLPKLNGVMRTFVASLAGAQENLLEARQCCHKCETARYSDAQPARAGCTNVKTKRAQNQAAIVLFKNCWMSTIETAFELAPYAEHMLASQARVPQIGWPYEDIFSTLDETDPRETERAAVKLRDHLWNFYSLSRNRAERDEVPYSLLNLSAVENIKDPYRKLLKGLRTLRAQEGGAKIVSDALECATVGDPALADLKGWLRVLSCSIQKLKNQRLPERKPDGSTDEAIKKVEAEFERLETPIRSLDEQLNRLVVWKREDELQGLTKEDVSRRPSSAFGGVSVFHYPDQQKDFEESMIAPSIAADSSVYTALAFEVETRWSTIAVDLYGGAAPTPVQPRPRHLPARLQFLLRTPTQLSNPDRLEHLVRLLRSAHLTEEKPVNFDHPADFKKILEFAKALFFYEEKPVNFDKPTDFAKALFFGEKALELAKTLTTARVVSAASDTTFGSR